MPTSQPNNVIPFPQTSMLHLVLHQDCPAPPEFVPHMGEWLAVKHLQNSLNTCEAVLDVEGHTPIVALDWIMSSVVASRLSHEVSIRYRLELNVVLRLVDPSLSASCLIRWHADTPNIFTLVADVEKYVYDATGLTGETVVDAVEKHLWPILHTALQQSGWYVSLEEPKATVPMILSVETDWSLLD